MIKSYLKYIRERVREPKGESSFVLRFTRDVLRKAKFVKNTTVEDLRSELKKQRDLIEVTDLGAGSRKRTGNLRKVSEIVESAAIQKKYSNLLTLMIREYGLKNCLELGTSFGLGTVSMALAGEDVKVTTIEGCPEIFSKAKANFDRLEITNVESIQSEFTTALKELEKQKVCYDLVYIDGNHRYEPTKEYFDFALKHTHNDSFIIFDDIHWSLEMEKAWQDIKNNPEISISIDLYRIGIVLKKKEEPKKHFTLKF